MTKFYSIGNESDELYGTRAINTGEFALPAEPTRRNIEFILDSENVGALEVAEAERGAVFVYELVPIGNIRDVRL